MATMEKIARALVFLLALFTIDPVRTQQLPPRFPSNMYGFIPENKSNGSLITSFNVTDPNSDVITLGIYDDFTRSCVYLNTTNSRGGFVTGNVYLINPDNFDYDRGQRDVRLAFTASDGANTVTGFVHVYVSDVNDNAPEFRRPAYIYEILENANFPSTYNPNITATDADDGANKVFAYSLHATGQSTGLYQGVFSIDPNNGNLTLNQVLDYETLTFYQYTIEAVDKGTPAMTGSADLTIKVTDVQDTPPFFQGLPYLLTIKENHLWSGRNILAQDGDRGIPRPIQYNLYDSECSRLFTLGNTTGRLLLKDVLDRDAGTMLRYQGVCRFQIQACEVIQSGEPTVNSTASTTVTVIVEDIDDNVPTFNLSHYNAYVDEEVSNIPLTIDGSIGIDVYDLDQGENSEFSLTVNYANGTKCTGIEANPSYIIGRATVLLRLVNGFTFDYETEAVVKLLVVATGRVNNSMTTTCSVTVYINNTNDDVNRFATTSEYPYPRTSDGTRIFKPDISKATTAKNADISTPPPTAQTSNVTATTQTNPLTRSDIDCGGSSISLHVPLDLLPSGQQVTWNDPACVVSNNGTHLTGDIDLGECGTYVVFNTTHVIFENELVSHASTTNNTSGAHSVIDYGNGPDSVIVVQCVYPRREQESLGFRPIQGQVRFYEKTLGHMQIHMREARDVLFDDMYPSQTEPRVVHLNDPIYIKLDTEQGNTTKVAINVDRCLATPSPSPLDTDFQELTDNGCPALPSVTIHSSPVSEVHLSFQAFKFTNHPSAPVYVHCEVYVCPLSDPHCVTGCMDSVARTRRAATGGIKTHLVSTGPFPVADDKDQGAFGGESTALVAVTGLCAVLAVAATVFGVMAWRGRRRLPLKETLVQ